MRPSMLLIVAVPIGAAVALGGASVAGSWQSAGADQRSETLASLSAKVGQLAFQVEAERDMIVWYISARRASSEVLRVVQQQERDASFWVRTVETGAAGVGSGYPQRAQAVAQAVIAQLRSLPNLRHQALDTSVSATEVIEEYNNLVSTLLAFDDQVASSSSDAQLTSTARTVATVARQEAEYSVQRAIVMYGLIAQNLNSDMLSQLNASIADQKADFAEFGDFATPSQVATFNNLLAASLEDRVISVEQDVLKNTNRIASLPIVPQDWWGSMSSIIEATQKFQTNLANSAADRASALRKRAITSAVVVGGIILLVLMFSLLLTAFAWRSMTEQSRRLNQGNAELLPVA